MASRPTPDSLIERALGTGIGASIVLRGVTYLLGELRARGDDKLETVRLVPGETYTIIARPAATKVERKLAARVESLAATEAKLSVPSRKQRKVARRLAAAQRTVDTAEAAGRLHTRRARRAVADEARYGARFDAVFTPSRKLAKVRAELEAARSELEASREAGLEAARPKRGRGRGSVRVYLP